MADKSTSTKQLIITLSKLNDTARGATTAPRPAIKVERWVMAQFQKVGNVPFPQNNSSTH